VRGTRGPMLSEKPGSHDCENRQPRRDRGTLVARTPDFLSVVVAVRAPWSALEGERGVRVLRNVRIREPTCLWWRRSRHRGQLLRVQSPLAAPSSPCRAHCATTGGSGIILALPQALRPHLLFQRYRALRRHVSKSRACAARTRGSAPPARAKTFCALSRIDRKQRRAGASRGARARPPPKGPVSGPCTRGRPPREPDGRSCAVHPRVRRPPVRGLYGPNRSSGSPPHSRIQERQAINLPTQEARPRNKLTTMTPRVKVKT